MPKNDTYQRLLQEAFKELDALEMLEHIKWELNHFYKCASDIANDSKGPKTT